MTIRPCSTKSLHTATPVGEPAKSTTTATRPSHLSMLLIIIYLKMQSSAFKWIIISFDILLREDFIIRTWYFIFKLLTNHVFFIKICFLSMSIFTPSRTKWANLKSSNFEPLHKCAITSFLLKNLTFNQSLLRIPTELSSRAITNEDSPKYVGTAWRKTNIIKAIFNFWKNSNKYYIHKTFIVTLHLSDWNIKNIFW